MSNSLNKRINKLNKFKAEFDSLTVDLVALQGKVTKLQDETIKTYGKLKHHGKILQSYKDDLNSLAKSIDAAIVVENIKGMASKLANSVVADKVEELEARTSMNAVFKQVVVMEAVTSFETTFVGDVLAAGVKLVEVAQSQDVTSIQQVPEESIQELGNTSPPIIMTSEQEENDVVPVVQNKTMKPPEWLHEIDLHSQPVIDFTETKENPKTYKEIVFDALYTFYQKALEFLDFITLGYFSTPTKKSEETSALRRNSFLSSEIEVDLQNGPCNEMAHV